MLPNGHARLWTKLEASGKMIVAYDLTVAATASEREIEVAGNAPHFTVVSGLTVIQPS